MPGPPPPPPGPPPPPMSLPPMKKFTPAASSAPDNRGALLSQIQKGTKLKKATTVDKSGPLVAGKIAGDNSTRSRAAPASSSLSTSQKTSPDSATSSPSRPVGGFANLTEELQYKMTLKKNKNSPVKEVKSETSSVKEVRNVFTISLSCCLVWKKEYKITQWEIFGR